MLCAHPVLSCAMQGFFLKGPAHTGRVNKMHWHLHVTRHCLMHSALHCTAQESTQVFPPGPRFPFLFRFFFFFFTIFPASRLFLFIFNLNLLFTIQTDPVQVTKAFLEGLPCFRDQPNTSSVFATLTAYISQQPQAGPQKGC